MAAKQSTDILFYKIQFLCGWGVSVEQNANIRLLLLFFFVFLIFILSIDVPASCKGSTSLNSKNVYTMLYPARASWYNIGIMLDVDINTLQAFDEDHGSVDKKLGAVINHWLNNGTNKTWTELAEAMGNDVVNQEGIKKKIMELK